MSDLLDRGRAILASQPFSVLLGVEMKAFTLGRCELRLAIKKELMQQHNFVHGGVLSYLADNALTFAGGSELNGQIVTSEMKINYVRPAVRGTLIARANCLSAGKTLAVVRCDLFVVQDGIERLCAAAQGTVAAAPTES